MISTSNHPIASSSDDRGSGRTLPPHLPTPAPVPDFNLFQVVKVKGTIGRIVGIEWTSREAAIALHTLQGFEYAVEFDAYNHIEPIDHFCACEISAVEAA